MGQDLDHYIVAVQDGLRDTLRADWNDIAGQPLRDVFAKFGLTARWLSPDKTPRTRNHNSMVVEGVKPGDLDKAVAETKLLTGIKYVEKPIKHY